VRNVRVFYPDDGEEVKYSLHGNGVTFRVRDFEVHEAVVVEFG
jgi:hypothetical protein